MNNFGVELNTGFVLQDLDAPFLACSLAINGGCRGTLRTASACTDGWLYLNAAEGGNPVDHSYYLEMRDRSGFDFEGHGQNDRPPIDFLSGLLLVYTDEGHVDNYTDPGADDNLWRFKYDCLSFEVLSMSGTGIGPAASPGNLEGDVKFTLGPGLSAFNYGFGIQNGPPTAVAQARPTTARVGQAIAFDGSASYDDLTPPNKLTYQWDFDGDGNFDASGQARRHAYTHPGTYNVRLRVTDTGGFTAVAGIKITVEANPSGPEKGATSQPLAATGIGSEMRVLGLALLAMSMLIVRYLRRTAERL